MNFCLVLVFVCFIFPQAVHIISYTFVAGIVYYMEIHSFILRFIYVMFFLQFFSSVLSVVSFRFICSIFYNEYLSVSHRCFVFVCEFVNGVRRACVCDEKCIYSNSVLFDFAKRTSNCGASLIQNGDRQIAKLIPNAVWMRTESIAVGVLSWSCRRYIFNYVTRPFRFFWSKCGHKFFFSQMNGHWDY